MMPMFVNLRLPILGLVLAASLSLSGCSTESRTVQGAAVGAAAGAATGLFNGRPARSAAVGAAAGAAGGAVSDLFF